MAVRALKGRRGMGLAGVGGGGAGVGWDDSVVPPGPRGWESRAPILGDLVSGGLGGFWDVYLCTGLVGGCKGFGVKLWSLGLVCSSMTSSVWRSVFDMYI